MISSCTVKKNYFDMKRVCHIIAAHLCSLKKLRVVFNMTKFLLNFQYESLKLIVQFWINLTILSRLHLMIWKKQIYIFREP